MNSLLARFNDVPSLVAFEMRGIFESCLQQAAIMLARVEGATDKPKMADDFWFADDDWRAFLRPYLVKDGVLQIPVKGVLLHDFPYQFGSWATGYDYIWKAFERGLGDSNVRGVALIVNSPGGEVAGHNSLVERMYNRRGEKPIRAFADESAYSAAYGVASAADRIVVSRTGGVGSIGVVTMHVDVSAAMESYGEKITFIFAGKHKVDGNSYEPLPEDVKARIQTRIDELYSVFVSTVARNRAMSDQAVRDTEALTFTATQATSNGLADEIGSLDDAVVAFARELEPEEEHMTKDAPVIDQAVIDSARAEGNAEGLKAGMVAERARINAILGCDEAKVRPKAALSAALKTDMTAEQARAFLTDLPEENTEKAAKSPFEAKMDADKHPEVGAPGAEQGAQPSRAERAFIAAGRPKKAA